MNRMLSVDLVRGLAVIAMIELHVFDAFASHTTRGSWYGPLAWFIGGGAAPLFVTLAGLATALAMRREGMRDTMIRRGVEIFSLGLFFRVQEWALGGEGSSSRMLLRVDVLNCLGISIILTALLLTWAKDWRFLAAFAAVWILLTPLFAPGDMILPPFGHYFGGEQSYALFPLFPWTGYAFAGAALGTFAHGDDERMQRGALAAAALYALVLTARLAFPDALHFERTNPNPVFAFERATASLGLIALARYLPFKTFLKNLGQHSLLVYWVHVDLCYGLLFHHWKRSLPWYATFLATSILVSMCYLLVYSLKRKERPCPNSALSPS